METLKLRKYNLWIWTKSMSPEKEKNSLISLSLARSEMFPTFTVRVCSNTWTNGKKNKKKGAKSEPKAGNDGIFPVENNLGIPQIMAWDRKEIGDGKIYPHFVLGANPLLCEVRLPLLCFAWPLLRPEDRKKGKEMEMRAIPMLQRVSRNDVDSRLLLFLYIIFQPCFFMEK